MEKIKCFEKELTYIKNKKIKEFAIKAIALLPDYFFIIPSSSSFKYHPKYALEDSGLVKHEKACVMLALEFFRLDWYKDFTDDDKDLIIVSLLLHDGFKRGVIQEEHTREDHPVIASNFVKNNSELQNIISDEYVKIIANNILTHMGQWRFGRNGQELMPKPLSKMQKLVHFIDYIASRRFLECNFNIEIKKNNNLNL
jgi:hypothetical protein